MYLADTTVLSKGHHPDFYDYMERMSVLAKRLYNAALFRLRQAYTGWEREARTANEKAVFEEIRVMQAKYPRGKERRISGSWRIRRRQAGRNSSAGGARKRPSQVFRREGCARSRRIGGQWTVPHAYGRPGTVRKGKPARRSNIKRPGGA